MMYFKSIEQILVLTLFLKYCSAQLLVKNIAEDCVSVLERPKYIDMFKPPMIDLYKSPVCLIQNLNKYCQLAFPWISPAAYSYNPFLAKKDQYNFVYDPNCKNVESLYTNREGAYEVLKFVSNNETYLTKLTSWRLNTIDIIYMDFQAIAFGLYDRYMMGRLIRSIKTIPNHCLKAQEGGMYNLLNWSLPALMVQMRPCPYPCTELHELFMFLVLSETDNANKWLEQKGYCAHTISTCVSRWLPSDFICLDPKTVRGLLLCTNITAVNAILTVYSPQLTAETAIRMFQTTFSDCLIAEWLTYTISACQKPHLRNNTLLECMKLVTGTNRCFDPVKFANMITSNYDCMGYGGRILQAFGLPFGLSNFYNLVLTKTHTLLVLPDMYCLSPQEPQYTLPKVIYDPLPVLQEPDM
ncbi:ORF24-like protein [Bufonid herpesvirus 1]|uniref:ORF24-like protein n=1 Tax=Bufonid herpesvirus 1 TaxID=2282206 RepID=UPI000EB6A119|nr:ORF24-like protein [Bufonid herpesvirus 1]AXF48634.1 ORF24-like protein [Bufonid herpesvirus 1]